MSQNSAPIGVFDSGLGGMTVLRALRRRFPNENFLYLGDTARLPYGSKSPETIRRYSEQNARFLRAQGVKALVIACNSASTQMREHEFEGLPCYNVIEPGARKALATSPRKRIGLLGTRATIQSQAYELELKRLDPKVEVFSQAAPLLVPLAEEGWDADPVANLIVYRYLQLLMQHQPDTLILGCTHYPLLEGSISRVTGSSTMLVDSGEAVGDELEKDFRSGRLKAREAPGDATLRICVTDASPAFMELAQRILGVKCEAELVNI